MTTRIGRNDPCPCGSGKKYKHCCGRSAAPTVAPADSHEGAVERAPAWVARHHRKAMAAAVETAIDDALSGIFDDEDEARAAMAGISEELWSQLRLNLTEWLLAEGDIEVKGETRRVAELLLGPRGPLLTVGQRAWLVQLARKPLRLYDVTEVVPDASITLCDALLTDQPPLVVTERSGSRSLRAGMQIGARVMEAADPNVLLSRSRTSRAPAGKAPGLPGGMDSEVVADAIEGAIRRSYAHWADAPIPALDDGTPREAIGSATGLERVKGLLRSCQDGEAQQAAQQGRREISYQFLWDALGLAR